MFRRFGYGFLLNAAGGDGGAGGSAGDGKGGESKAVFTEEQVTAIGTMVNAALTSKVPKMVSGGVAEAMKSFDWKGTLGPVVKELVPQGQPGASGGGGGGSGDDANKSKADVNPEVVRQLQKLTDDFEKERKARLAAEAQALQIKTDQEFSDARGQLMGLLKPHASETLHDVWVDNLVHHKRLKVENGATLLEVSHAPIKGMPLQKEFLPLEQAVPILVAAEEAKRFMPAPGGASGGNGSPGPRGGNGGGSKPSLDSKDPAERAAARLATMGIDFNAEFSG